MRPEAVDLVPLVCVACRTVSEGGRNMFTVHVERALRTSPSGEVLEGILRCGNPDCGRRYPVIDGIPLLVADLAAFLARDPVGLVEDLEPEVAACLAEAGPDDSHFARGLEHLSIYLDAHWGDRAQPAPDGPGESFGMGQIATRLAARAPAGVQGVVELGSSLGRGLAELAAGAQVAVGIDLNFGALRRARRLLTGETLRYARRVAGRHYLSAAVAAGDLVRPQAVLVCADALDPPLAPLAFGRVAALNLLDAVREPTLLLAVAAGLCAAGGELILASPYAWQSTHVGEGHRLGGGDPATEVARRLRAGEGLDASFTVEEEADVPWSLRRDARSAVTYSVHYLRARKN